MTRTSAVEETELAPVSVDCSGIRCKDNSIMDSIYSNHIIADMEKP